MIDRWMYRLDERMNSRLMDEWMDGWIVSHITE